MSKDTQGSHDARPLHGLGACTQTFPSQRAPLGVPVSCHDASSGVVSPVMPMPGPDSLVAVSHPRVRTGGVLRPAATTGAPWLKHGDLGSSCVRIDPGASRRPSELVWAGLAGAAPETEVTP